MTCCHCIPHYGTPQTDEGAVTPVNGAIPNGDICSSTSTPDIPAIEVSPSDSPPISFQDDDSSTAREDSLTPPALYAGSTATPGRRAMMALKKVCMLQYKNTKIKCNQTYNFTDTSHKFMKKFN